MGLAQMDAPLHTTASPACGELFGLPRITGSPCESWQGTSAWSSPARGHILPRKLQRDPRLLRSRSFCGIYAPEAALVLLQRPSPDPPGLLHYNGHKLGGGEPSPGEALFCRGINEITVPRTGQIAGLFRGRSKIKRNRCQRKQPNSARLSNCPKITTDPQMPQLQTAKSQHAIPTQAFPKTGPRSNCPREAGHMETSPLFWGAHPC